MKNLDPARRGRRGTVAALNAGDAAAASFVLCAISGWLLRGSYDASDGARSIAAWLLASPVAVFLRNLHYWTAQLLVVSIAWWVWKQLRGAATRRAEGGFRVALVLCLPVIAFLMFSGFALRGDADARAFQPLFVALVTDLPLFGPTLAEHLFDVADARWVLFHHGVTATVFVGLIVAAYARRVVPRAIATLLVTLAAGAMSLVVSPGLNDGLSRQASAPWFSVGAVEVLRWVPDAVVLVAIASAGLWLMWALPRFSAAGATRVRRGLLVVAGGYGALCVVGLFWNVGSEGREFQIPNRRGDWRVGSIFPAGDVRPISLASVPVIRGRPEGCVICHDNITGFSSAHRPEEIGCASCHAGDTTTLNAERAHAGLIRVPGNLADAPHTCGTAGCHADIIPRVETSIMATFAGVIDVNRRVFGEPADPAAPPVHVRDLGHSAADSHLRQLCVSCHLGTEKEHWGPIVQESRGGGCNACHLSYSPEAALALDRYEASPFGVPKTIPKVHPSFTLNPENAHCFGCHSRSGRIATNYEGWHELREAPTAQQLAQEDARHPQYRLLDDGRHFVRVTPDVHQTRGMDCIDCHTSSEVMGDGRRAKHKGDQLQVRCEDCHARPLASQPAAKADAETLKLLALRKWPVTADQRLGTTRSGGVLANVFVTPEGTGQLRRKRTGEVNELRPPLEVCVEGAGHARLSCASCHTPWAPRCASCHTAFDPAAEGFDHLLQQPVKGAWVETSGEFEVAPPTLGILLDRTDPARPNGVVDTFVPGMILELDRNRLGGRPADLVFRRLYARMAAHTTSRGARSCRSCHNDPVAIGYGRGTLEFEVSGLSGRWRFSPAHASLPQDGLPADAWIGFQQRREGMVSTREDVRPFSVAEQRRILTVGACLTCHADDSSELRPAVADFGALVARRGRSCVLPTWSD